MADERKYREDEVMEIFDLAVRRHHDGEGVEADEPGMSLAELQEVGLEVGLDPERVAEAAMAVESRRGVLPLRTYLGMPVSVGRIVELPRAITDREWQLVVTELRDVFGARGRVGSHGGIREWTNGNLFARLEPTETGHRLRMGTIKGDAMASNRLGLAGLTTAGILVVAEVIATMTGSSILTGDIWTLRGAFLPLMIAMGSIMAPLANAFTLPRWARAREGQMEYLAGSVTGLVEGPPKADEPNP